MICLIARPFSAILFLCAAAIGAALPASAQNSMLVPVRPGASTTLRPLGQQPGFVFSRSYGSPMQGYGTRNPSYAPSSAPVQYVPGTSGFGVTPGVPLAPGFGGNVPPQPGFGYQPGVTPGPGFGGQNQQLPIVSNQPEQYGANGMPVGPTWYGNATGSYYQTAPTTGYLPPLLGGYYFSNYCSASVGPDVLPTMYSLYSSFPAFFYVSDNVGVTVLGTAPTVDYDTGYLPYSQPSYQVNNYNYTVNNYYASPSGDGGQGQTPQAGPSASAAPTGYVAAFADIQKAWLIGNIDLLKKHLRDNDIKIAVSIKGKYSYSIASGDFVTITKDAFDKLTTSSFEFTSIRKAGDGDVTGYAKHVYLPSDSSESGKRTIYLAFTLSNRGEQWYITSIDSSTERMDSQSSGSAGTHDQSLAAPGASRSTSTSS